MELTETQRQTLDNDGFVVLERVFAPDVFGLNAFAIGSLIFSNTCLNSALWCKWLPAVGAQPATAVSLAVFVICGMLSYFLLKELHGVINL